MQSGMVFDIREFTVHDGPGVRTTVFLKGCPLCCSWCHNPEGMSPEPETMHGPAGKRIVGKCYTAEQLADILNRLVPVLRANSGGITFSGGEPLRQASFLVEVMDRLKKIHTLLDTSGYASPRNFQSVAEKCDLVYFDLKLIDPAMHLIHAGVDNSLILSNLHLLSTMNVPYVIRVPLIPGLTDTTANLEAIARTVEHLHGLVRVDLLPYNRAAGGKYRALGKEFTPTYDGTRRVQPDLRVFEAANVFAQVVGAAWISRKHADAGNDDLISSGGDTVSITQFTLSKQSEEFPDSLGSSFQSDDGPIRGRLSGSLYDGV